MPITFNDFLQQANATRLGARSIIVDDAQTPQSVKHGIFIFSSGQKVNDATMAAFKEALQQEYGVFGLHAFDTVVGTRAQLHKSLRACDVKKIVSSLESLKTKRFDNEEARQMETNPAVLELAPDVRRKVADIIQSHWHGPKDDQLPEELSHALSQCKTHEDIAQLVNNTIMTAIQLAKQQVTTANTGIQPLTQGESLHEAGTPMGLSRLSNEITVGKHETSVEDRVRRGWVGAGMRVNFGQTSRPVIFEKLKTNGVEPGFIYHNDWSKQDTSALLIDTHSQNTIASLNQFIAASPKLTAATQGKTDLEKGLIVGRAHPAGIAFAAEYVLTKELDKLAQNPQPDTPLLRAIKQHFGPNVQKSDFFPPNGGALSPQQQANLAKVKKDCFVQLRDAVMSYSKTAAATDPNAQLPVFKHFTERHILKLDYNESDRLSPAVKPKSAQFRLPKRVSVKGGAIHGTVYRAVRLTTADKASVGAVKEAFANDLTRLLGVPAQDLTLVRGQYSDGHPKIMLEAKFAEGYKDFDGIYIEDGRIKADVNAEPLGKFKAIYLALADRDAIGSHGQNKGFIGDPDNPTQQKTFFAIDPGHSLEGNGQSMVIRDNLSFKQSDFHNFSIFDDDTRFHKMEGVLKLRELRDSGAITKLFMDYGLAFNPQARGISDAEKAIREDIMDNLMAMQSEFLGQIDKMTAACADQLKLYDELGADPTFKHLQEQAIDTIENLEKFTSPTTWKSENGKVELKHLSVIEETRIPWTAKKVGNTLVYTSAKPLPQNMHAQLSTMQRATASHSTVTIDSQNKTTITVPLSHAQEFFNAFTENQIIQIKHSDELAARTNRPVQQPAGQPVQQPNMPPPPQASLIDNPPPPNL